VHADGRYEGFVWSAMLEKAYPLVRPGGCPFFRRGGARGRAGAFKNHRKVCVLDGAPRGRAGGGGQKTIAFSLICSPAREYGGKGCRLGLCTMVSAPFSRKQIVHTLYAHSGPACVLGRVASPWLRPRAPALQRPPSRASPRFFSFLINVFRASSRYPRSSPLLSLALSSFSLFLLLFVLTLSLSLYLTCAAPAGAPRLRVGAGD
jgi:hypothetical protein